MLLRLKLIALLALGMSATIFGPAHGFGWQSDEPLLEASQVLNIDNFRERNGTAVLTVRIAEGYYLYRSSLSVANREGNDVALQLPDGVLRHDEFFGETEVYPGGLLSIQFPSEAQAPLTLHWQGCAEAGLCYPPQTLPLPDSAGTNTASRPQPTGHITQPKAIAPETSTAPATPALAADQRAAERLNHSSPAMAALVFFGLGLLLAFTPCTLPMIPIISSMIIGTQAPPRRALALSFAYVLAMAATYAVLGVAAGLIGTNLQAAMQSPWLLSVFAALFAVLAASLFGLFELQLPAALTNRLHSTGQGYSGGSLAGAAALGLLSALLVGPCMTAPLAGALLYIGQTGSAVTGGAALFALGLGMGLPLLAIAVFGAHLLPRPGPWMERIRIAFGFMMIGMAVMMLTRFLAPGVSLLLWGSWGLSMAFGLLALAQAIQTRQRLVWPLRFGAALAAFWSTLLLLGAASGGTSVSQPLGHLRLTEATPAAAATVDYVSVKTIADVDAQIAAARERGEWVMIDFYADWCVSCHIIEREVLQHPEIAPRLAAMQVLRPDVTRNDAADRALMKHWQVLGPPTIILIAPDGNERRAQRVVGEVTAADFIDRLDAVNAP